MTTYFSTAEAAEAIGCTNSRLVKALWRNQIDRPPKSPAGTYLWEPTDVERASWQLLGRAPRRTIGGDL